MRSAGLSGQAEAARVRAARYRNVELPPDAGIARMAALAALFFDAPIATVSIVDRERVVFAASHGLDGGIGYIPRDDGVFATAMAADSPYVVDDTLADPRTADNGFLREHNIRFYAGTPLVTFDGHRLGVVAVMAHNARTASPKELTLLVNLAAIVMEQLELRVSALDAVRIEKELRGAAEDERDNARRDRDTARFDSLEARRDRELAQFDRDRAQTARDDAIRDRGVVEQDRDLIQEYASVLQRTLLPPALPRINGMALSAYYRAASVRQVGGDFYDVFALGGSRWAFFVGDVLGHGPEAATVTSLIRYTLRSAALHYPDPIRGLTELNAVLLREAEPRRFCTVVFGTFEPHVSGEGFQITLATGGHPPPLLLDPVAGAVTEVRPRGGMLVGALPDAVFDACTAHMHSGQTLMCYTDGLIEARRGADAFDQERLGAFALEHATGGAQGVIDGIAALVPTLGARDDVAVLAIQITAGEPEPSPA